MDIDAAVFDVFGTLTDWRSGVTEALTAVGNRAGLQADWSAVSDAWRRRYRPALLRVVTGELPWLPLDGLHRLTSTRRWPVTAPDSTPSARRTGTRSSGPGTGCRPGPMPRPVWNDSTTAA
ncbi:MULTISPECIES: hypothetical protein [Streptomyces]|uniref:Haloacid dehalogenase type II n=2 Tax=Streptomyces TaxID=1883 RepID=A0ABS1MJF4_9ACTN|nr:hypothetical protein [Streptomyces sp. 9-7]MBL1087850.1 hypothetical protein [Streptomyces sp. 9-7]